MQTAELVSIRDWLRYFVSTLQQTGACFGHGSDNALDKSIHLISHALSLPSEHIDMFLDAKISSHEKVILQDIIEKRAHKKIPAAYITGKAWLMGYCFHSDPRAIIPRSFLAELLATECAPWIQDPEAIHNVLDLCTGSGCLAIIIANTFPNATVDAVDISAPALELAKANLALHGLEDRINLIQSDLFNSLSQSKKYDITISNPPYVTEEAMHKLPSEYKHEPSIALASGKLGLDCIEKIVNNAAKHLQANGWLFVEVGHNKSIVIDQFPEHPFTWISDTSEPDRLFCINADSLALPS